MNSVSVRGDDSPPDYLYEWAQREFGFYGIEHVRV